MSSVGVGRRCMANVAANMVKSAAAGAQFVARVVGLHVLRHVIELHVAARDHHLGFAVVFHVVGAKPRILVAHVHVAIGIEDFPDLALLVRFERGLAAGRERHQRLLRGLASIERTWSSSQEKRRAARK